MNVKTKFCQINLPFFIYVFSDFLPPKFGLHSVRFGEVGAALTLEKSLAKGKGSSFCPQDFLSFEYKNLRPERRPSTSSTSIFHPFHLLPISPQSFDQLITSRQYVKRTPQEAVRHGRVSLIPIHFLVGTCLRSRESIGNEAGSSSSSLNGTQLASINGIEIFSGVCDRSASFGDTQ